MNHVSHPARRSLRPLMVALALLGTLGLLGTACTKDDSASDDSASDDSAGKDDGDAAADDSANDTGGTSADFVSTVDAATAEIEATTDACQLIDTVGIVAEVGNPVTKDENEAAIGFFVAMANKMADTAGDPDLENRLRSGADSYEQFAKDADYDPEQLDLDGDGPDLPEVADAQEAMDEWFSTQMVNCLPEGLEVPEG